VGLYLCGTVSLWDWISDVPLIRPQSKDTYCHPISTITTNHKTSKRCSKFDGFFVQRPKRMEKYVIFELRTKGRRASLKFGI
jgi:hypothetical protein